MKIHINLGLVLTLFTALCCANIVQAASGEIRITLYDTDTNRTISDAQIELQARDQTDLAPQITDAQGQGLFSELPPGLYDAEIHHPNYQAGRLTSIRVQSGKLTPVELKLKFTSSGVEEVVVYATEEQGERLGSVGSSRLNRESLRSAPGGGGDVLRSLDGLPGLFSDGDFSSYTVRGNGPRDNLILVDGIELDSVVHFSDAFGDREELEGGGRYSIFAPNIVNSATFQPGGWGPRYAGKAGSLLELEVAKGNPETATFTANLDIAGPELGYSGPSGFHKDTSFLFSARHLDFTTLFETVGLDDIGKPKLSDIIFKSSSQLGDASTLEFLAIYASEAYERNVENVLATDEKNNGDWGSIDLVDNTRDMDLLAITWIQQFGNTAELSNKLYSRGYSEETDSGEAYPDLTPVNTPARDIITRPDIMYSHRKESELGWLIDFGVDNGLGRIESGIVLAQEDVLAEQSLSGDWYYFVFDSRDYRPDPDQKFLVLTPEQIDNRYDDSENRYAFYLNQRIDIGALELRAGARYDYDSYTEQGITSPRIGAAWQVGDRTFLSATAGRYHQHPDIKPRASKSIGLQNEIIDQISLGIRYAFDSNLSVSVEPYYQELSDLIVEQDGIEGLYANTGSGEIYGVDTSLVRQFSERWSGTFTYSYNQAKVKDADNQNSYDADFSRPHAFTIGGVWEISSHWKLSARWKWASGTPSDSYIVHDNVLGDGNPLRYSRETTAYNTGRYGAYKSLNFRIDYFHRIGPVGLTAFLDVLNALGSSNPSNNEFNMLAGKNFEEEGAALPLMGVRLDW